VVTTSVDCALGSSWTDPHKIIEDFGGKTADGPLGFSLASPGFDIENPVMIGAHHGSSPDLAISKRGIFMGASVVDGKKPIVDVKDGDGRTLYGDGSPLPEHQIAHAKDGSKALSVFGARDGPCIDWLCFARLDRLFGRHALLNFALDK
jgi:hypothetical protein